jgi:hypothetical protein
MTEIIFIGFSFIKDWLYPNLKNIIFLLTTMFSCVIIGLSNEREVEE